MNRIDQLFIDRKEPVLSVYFTAGYPELNDTASIILALEEAGADLVEIGFPFSDPVADGPVIQASSHRALENGMNLDILFAQLKPLAASSRIPKIMMGYYNTVYRFGVEKFISSCTGCGVDGVILPDLPAEVYEREYRNLFEQAGLHFICLVAPQTSPERAGYLRSLSRGFLYRLSMSATTGSAVTRIQAIQPPAPVDAEGQKLPELIGFGIHDHASFSEASKQADGAIIGTAFIRRLEERLIPQATQEGPERVKRIQAACLEFIREIRGIR